MICNFHALSFFLASVLMRGIHTPESLPISNIFRGRMPLVTSGYEHGDSIAMVTPIS
jgi:hypothetical protein